MGAAREKVRVARALGTLPRVARALAHGELSYAKVRALTRVATPETEERLLSVGRAGTAEHVERIVRGWRRMDRNAENRESTRQHKSRALHVYPDEDGMVVIRGRLTPEVGALLMRALEASRETVNQPVRVEDTPTMAQQQADALALVAETALHHGSMLALRESATRLWYTSMRRRSRIPITLASPSSRTVRTFPRKRRGAWRATQAEW